MKKIIVISPSTGESIIRELLANKYYGYSPENVIFVVQKEYHEFAVNEDDISIDITSPGRTRGAGDALMRTLRDPDAFYVTPDGTKNYLGKTLIYLEQKTLKLLVS